MVTAEYAAYLASSAWQSKAHLVRAHCRHRCYVCGEDYKRWNVPLDVNHATYEHLGNEPMTDLFPVCRFHHVKGTYTWGMARFDKLAYFIQRRVVLRWLNPFYWAWIAVQLVLGKL